jgi:catechol 2,3-dioxygenase-like lactoylglutathione lyase family enzyme
MTVKRMDHVGIVVDNLDAAIAFFTELGLEAQNRMHVDGAWVDRVVGLDGMNVEIAMMRTPDGNSAIPLATH